MTIALSPSTDGIELGCPSTSVVCAFVDALPPNAAGELVFGGRDATADGAVFVDRGRVCWAAARGLARRLTDLLARPGKVGRAELELQYRACKRQRAPLGEHLVSTGIVTASELRAALLMHTVLSLQALCAPDARAAWFMRRAGGYSPRFTFSTTELLPRAYAADHPALATAASVELAECFGEGEWGVAYVRSETRAAPDPIALHGTPPDRVDALLRLGRWAASSLDLTRIGHADDALVATVTDGGALVAWRSGATIIAGHTRVTGPARLLNRRARARRKDVPHGRL